MEDTSEIVEFDARTLKILKRFPLAPGEEPTGLAFDPKKRRLFSTCANRKLVISDADSGKVVQTLEIGPGPDGCVFDAETGLIFSSSGGDGTLAIVKEHTPDRYEVVKTVKTQVSAKTLALDPKTHRIYLSAATPERRRQRRRKRRGADDGDTFPGLSSSWSLASKIDSSRAGAGTARCVNVPFKLTHSKPARQ